MNRHVIASYSDYYDGGFYIFIEKHKLELFPEIKVIKEVDINDNISAKLVTSTRAFYPVIKQGNTSWSDETRKPEKISEIQYLIWEYNGLTYSVVSAYGGPGKNEFQEEAIKFINSYIESIETIE